MERRLSWQAESASVAGRDHKAAGRGCEDASRCVALGDSIAVCVADGVGSARFGGVGAELAVIAAAEALRSAMTCSCRPRAVDAIVSAHRALDELRASWFPWVPFEDLATTLLVVIAGDDGFESAQIGDGAIVVWTTQRRLVAIDAHRSGEYVNVTDVLTVDDPRPRIHAHSASVRPAGVAVMTDGIEWIALRGPERQPVPGFFAPLFDRLQAGTLPRPVLEQFLASDPVSSRTGDDVTLALVVRR